MVEINPLDGNRGAHIELEGVSGEFFGISPVRKKVSENEGRPGCGRGNRYAGQEIIELIEVNAAVGACPVRFQAIIDAMVDDVVVKIQALRWAGHCGIRIKVCYVEQVSEVAATA